jgi:SAM-dependent methyltransferase
MTSYVLDASYADTFFQELSPAWLNYARAVNGLPSRGLDRPFTYLELGAGFGHSAVVNAAAFPHGEFHACDFNPEHVRGGRDYADSLGVRNIQFHEASFERLLDVELPPFDFIVLHGVYSWVGAEQRESVREIIRRKLGPGGLVYVSYNCMPGWASELPVRRMLVELAAAAPGDSAAKMRHAVEALERMKDRKLRFFDANSEAARAIESYGKVPANYLAHEFLNETWQPFYSVDVADEMASANVTLIGSATLPDNHPMLVIDEAAAESLKSLTTPRQVHLATDFATNRRFRRDIFIRSDSPRSSEDAARALESAIIGCVGDPQQLTNKVKVPRGQITFQADFMQALQALLHEGSTTLAEAAGALGGERRNRAEILRNLAFLVAGGALAPFAQARRYSMPAEVMRPANPIVERSLANIIRHQAARAIPSEILGNGVLVRPAEALAIVELLAGTPADHVTAAPREVVEHVATTLLPSLARLQLVN